MHPPLRILRASVDDTPGRQPQLSPQEIDRQDRIVEAAGRLLCQFGREGMTLRMIAASLRLTPAMVERHFLDFDSLMGEVFTRHLQSLLAAMEKIPPAASDKQAARRAVYAARTRNGFGAHTAMHALFIRQRGSLPDDISQPLDQLRLAVGAVLSREHGDAVLNLLDSLTLDLPKIEAFIRLLEGPASVAPDVAPAYTPEPVLTEALIASMFRPDPSLADHDLLEDQTVISRKSDSQRRSVRGNRLPAANRNSHPPPSSMRAPARRVGQVRFKPAVQGNDYWNWLAARPRPVHIEETEALKARSFLKKEPKLLQVQVKPLRESPEPKRMKVFCFFFSKKKTLLPWLKAPGSRGARRPAGSPGSTRPSWGCS